MRKFAERLRELRTEKNLSMDKLGKAVGLGSSSICSWEKGQQDISSDYVIILAKFFGVTADYLLGLED